MQESPGLHVCCAAALEQLALSFKHCSEAQSCCNGGFGSRVLDILLAEHLPPATPAEASARRPYLLLSPMPRTAISVPSGPAFFAAQCMLSSCRALENPRWLTQGAQIVPTA